MGSRTTYQPMPFSSFSLSNAQTKVQIWINSQKFRVLSKNHLLFKSLQNWPYSHWDKRFFLMAISDKVKNTIQTASFGIAALKERVGGTGRMGEEVAVKRNWVKLTFWVNVKLKLPLNKLFSPQLASAAAEPQNAHFIHLLHLRGNTQQKRQPIQLCSKSLT